MLSAMPSSKDVSTNLKSGSGWALGHSLLKITLEDEFEAQPLTIDKGQIWIAADARIDNRAELSDRLHVPPDILETTSDSVIISLAWKRWGAECVDYLIGAFAFAVWNSRERQLFLARDHAGERPLFFSTTSNAFAFATAARSILSCPGISGELDEEQLARDLIGLPPDKFRTRFRDVNAVEAGHVVLIRDGSVVQKRYWHYDSLPKIILPRDEDYVEAFLEVFDEAVRCRLRCSGGVASELSSGLDSGSVTATAAMLLGAQGRRLKSFTSIPRLGSLASRSTSKNLIKDEGPYAADVAALYPNIEHEFIESSGSNMLRELDRNFGILDLPCAGALNSIWANLILDKMAASGTKVLLTGALGNFTISYTGDEILYPLFQAGAFRSAFRKALDLRKAGLSSGRHALSLTLLSLLPWRIRRQLDPLLRSVSLRHSAIRQDRAKEWNLLDQFRRYNFQRMTSLPRCQETYFHRNQYGEYNAAANAGWGIDVRDPTADKRVYEFCVSIPPEQYLVGGQGRSLIRRAMVGRLPTSTLCRTARGTQSADWYESLSNIRGPLLDEINRLRESPGANDLIDLSRLSAALDSWPQSAKESQKQGDLYQYVLTRGVACGYFIRRAEDAFGKQEKLASQVSSEY